MKDFHLRTDGRIDSALGCFDPRARVAAGLIAALWTAGVPKTAPLFPLIPFALFVLARFGFGTYWRVYGRRLKGVALFMALSLWVTWPAEGAAWWQPTVSGGLKGLEIAARMYLVSFFILPLIASLGLWQFEAAVERFGVPEKLRVMLILCLRYVFMLSDTMATRVRALRLRMGSAAPFLVRLGGYAALFGTTLLHCSDRAERAWMALQARGGLAGFHRSEDRVFVFRDWLLTGAALVSAGFSLGVLLWIR